MRTNNFRTIIREDDTALLRCHSLTHSLNHSLTHSLTESLTLATHHQREGCLCTICALSNRSKWCIDKVVLGTLFYVGHSLPTIVRPSSTPAHDWQDIENSYCKARTTLFPVIRKCNNTLLWYIVPLLEWVVSRTWCLECRGIVRYETALRTIQFVKLQQHTITHLNSKRLHVGTRSYFSWWILSFIWWSCTGTNSGNVEKSVSLSHHDMSDSLSIAVGSRSSFWSSWIEFTLCNSI